jgi:uncharacterized membrane protein YdcZ (DUF606 family)
MKITLSPRGFLVTAVLLGGTFALAHALGLREQTRFLSGTPAWVFLGALYGVLYFASVLIVPPLVIAALTFAAIERILRAGEAVQAPPMPPETTP